MSKIKSYQLFEDIELLDFRLLLKIGNQFKTDDAFPFKVDQFQSQTFKLDIQELFGNLIRLCRKNCFKPHLIEISLFDTERSDKNRRHFHVAIACSDSRNLTQYIQLLRENVELNPSTGSPVSGYKGAPLIHNRLLYRAPYYALDYESGKVLTTLGESPEPYIAYGNYYNQLEPAREMNTLLGQIQEFFESCGQTFENNIRESPAAPLTLNSAILLPLPKKSDYRLEENNGPSYDGGGVFIFGEAEHSSQNPEFDINKFLVILRNYLMFSVFDITYSATDMRMLRFRKQLVQLNIVHHFKSQLMTKVEIPINDVLVHLKSLNATSANKAHAKMEIVREFVSHLVMRISLLIKSIQEPEITVFEYKDFESVCYQTRKAHSKTLEHYKIAIEVVPPQPQAELVRIRLDHVRIQLVMEEIIGNAIKMLCKPERTLQIVRKSPRREQLEKYVKPISNKTIRIFWEVDTAMRSVTIRVFNSGTRINASDALHLGRDYFANSRSNSTGLGLKIVNEYLQSIGANFLRKEERYFSIRNVISSKQKGVEIEFSFPILESSALSN
ncbi:MAG: ATP-binding protein [Bacteroidota bacterium]